MRPTVQSGEGARASKRCALLHRALQLSLLILAGAGHLPAGAQATSDSPSAAEASADELRVTDTLIAVVTRKAGVGARLAHDHLIVAIDPRVALRFDPQTPLAAQFDLDFAVQDLTVDPAELQKIWGERLLELGVLDEPYGKLSEKNRGKIRRAMLGEEQLHAEAHPQIRARLGAVRAQASERGSQLFDYELDLTLEVRGAEVTQPTVARWWVDEVDEGRHHFEAVGSFRFSDFGIEPYSALLGAVRNDDTFYVFLRLSATRE